VTYFCTLLVFFCCLKLKHRARTCIGEADYNRCRDGKAKRAPSSPVVLTSREPRHASRVVKALIFYSFISRVQNFVKPLNKYCTFVLYLSFFVV